MGYYAVDETEDLQHHGILGQKWGKQSGPPYPLDQKAHQKVVSNAGSAERFAAIERGGGRAASLHTSNAPDKGNRFINSKMDVSAMKIRSKSDLKTAKKYFATYVLGKNEVDTYLKANTPFSRIQTSKEMEEFPFYATYKKHDVQMYEGLFGKNLKSRALAAAKASGDAEQIQKAKDMEVYRVQLKNTHNLKVPSDESAGNITAKLLNKGDFKENLKASIDDSKSKMKRPSQQLLFNKAEKAMDKHPEPGLNTSDKKNLYKALNLTLTNHNDKEVAMQKTFYSEMKRKGYHALVDTNDQEYSSYHAKRPMIVFDVDKTKVDKVHTLDDKRVDKLYKRYNVERLIKDSIEQTFGTPMKMLKHDEGGTYMYYAIEDDEMEDLQHHGIRGQKWGIRRFQNPDGTRTAAGKRREREDSDDAQNDAPKRSIDKKTVAKVAIGALAVGGTAFLIANPTTREALAKYGKTAVSSIKDKFSKENLKEAGKKIGKKVAERASKAGDAMIDAALMSIGGIAISKLAKKLAPPEDASEAQKIGSKVAIDTASAGIRTMTGGANNSNYSSGNKNSSGKVDRSSKEYQNLFNGLEDDETARNEIKRRANEGASMEELQKYRDSIQHYDFGEWDESFVFSEFRW